MIKILNKNSRKMNQKHHQKIHNFYFIYKSPGAMLVTSENTRNDVWRPLKYENPLKNRHFSYRSATVGLPIVNQSYHADGRELWVTKQKEEARSRDTLTSRILRLF